MSNKDATRLTMALLSLGLCFAFLLMSMGTHIHEPRNSQMLPVHFEWSAQKAFAVEKTEEEPSNGVKSATTESEPKGKEGETKSEEAKSSAEAEAEGKPVKYSAWQDVVALVIAAVVIAAAYFFIKQLAAKQPK